MKYKLHKVTSYIDATSRTLSEVIAINEKGLEELMLEPYTKSSYNEEEWLLLEEAYTRVKVWYQELDLVEKIILKERLQLPNIDSLEIEDSKLRDFILDGMGYSTYSGAPIDLF